MTNTVPNPVFEDLPQAIRRTARIEHLAEVPCLLIPAHAEAPKTGAPMLLWMHGRTASKEVDPGRYLRMMRSGIAVCAVDLPGHGERHAAHMNDPARVVDIVLQMVDEIDAVTWAAIDALGVNPDRVALGGMSAGGMAAIARLCLPHRFRALTLEATSGDWSSLASWSQLDEQARAKAMERDPIRHLDGWRPLPVLAAHARGDQWIPWSGQQRFLELLRTRGCAVQTEVFDETGALHEHVGFGRYAAQVKETQRDFLVHALQEPT